MKRTIGWSYLLVLALTLTACSQKKPGGDTALKSGMPWWVWVIIVIVALAIAFVALVYFKVIKLDLSFLKSKPKTEIPVEGFSSDNLAADGLPIIPPPPDMFLGDLPVVPPPPDLAMSGLPAVPPPPGTTTEEVVSEKPSKKKKVSQEPEPAAFGADNLPPLPPMPSTVPSVDQPGGVAPGETPVMPPPIPFPFVAQPPDQNESAARLVEPVAEPEKKSTRRKKGEGEVMPVPDLNSTTPSVDMPLPPVPPPSLNIPPMPVPAAPVDNNATVKAGDKGLPPIETPTFTIPAAPGTSSQGDSNATVKASDKGLPPLPPMPMPVPPPPVATQTQGVAAFCGNCGTKLPPQAKFCPTCGAKRIGA